MVVMRGVGRSTHTEGIGTLGLNSMVAPEGEVVIMVLDTTLLMCMLCAFQCITKWQLGRDIHAMEQQNHRVKWIS
jgi:hypothetical protein